MLTELLVTVFYGYAIVGAIFGFYFVWWGAARIDPDAHPLPAAIHALARVGSVMADAGVETPANQVDLIKYNPFP
jgi:hypothetical protein